MIVSLLSPTLFHPWATTLNSNPMHLLEKLFTPTFWTHEVYALRDTALELLKVSALFLVGRIAINRLAIKVAAAVIAGQVKLGLIPHESATSRQQTVGGLIRSVGQYALFFVFAVLFLRALGFDAVSVATSASVAGLAFGFGAQKLVKDIISGFFIIMENQYVVGDYVTINGTTGRIEEMGMRVVKIRDDSGRLYIFANGDITAVCNQSRGAITNAIEIGIPPGTDIEHVRPIIDDAGQTVYDAHPELGLTMAPSMQGVGGGDSMRTVIRILIQSNKPETITTAGVVLRDVVHDKLLAGGITPF